MASKTVARSGARTSRSKGSSRSAQPRRSPARRPAKAPRRPAGRRNHSLVTNAGLACGRAVRATWLMLAKGTGSTARSVGRAREIDPGHRRDGIALALLGRGRRHRCQFLVRRRPPGRRMGRLGGAHLHRLGGGGAARGHRRGRSAVDAHRAESGGPPPAGARRDDGGAAGTGPLASVGRLAGHSGRARARRGIHRLRHRGTAFGRVDQVDLRAAVVHRRVVRPTSVDWHHDPRTA